MCELVPTSLDKNKLLKLTISKFGQYLVNYFYIWTIFVNYL